MPATTPQSAGAPPLTFGIYPGGRVGANTGAPDESREIEGALRTLAGHKPLIVRGYLLYTDAPSDWTQANQTPLHIERYVHGRRRQLDLVLSYVAPSGNVDGWVDFVREAIRRYGSELRYLQVTLEPNFDFAGIDGSYPNVRDALVRGVLAAHTELQGRHLNDVRVGFSVAEPQEWLGGDGDFWTAIGALGGPAFVRALDYVGIALYPDAFAPVAPLGQPGDVRDLVVEGLRHLRECSLPQAGIPAGTPIHVAENGTPTGPDRGEAQQAQTLEAMIRTIDAYRGNYNVRTYELFDLRDVDSTNPDPFHQLGIMRDDYAPKAAFGVYRDLIAELGASR